MGTGGQNGGNESDVQASAGFPIGFACEKLTEGIGNHNLMTTKTLHWSQFCK